ncbi:MAG: hypothetical protein H6R17_1806 [Proteobacteria bacterium]|nr:hypothetical protein [Pseudomonadota bacterium]
MTELIRQMSQIQVPDDLLRQIDLDGLIKDFKKNFERLGNFRKTRDNYEKRGFWEKVGDVVTFDSTMENAQLDAVETQAAFSKAIGQLMVLSIVQSQRLQQQQELLSTQQGIIKDQTQRIERHTLELQDQHEILAKQNAELEKLVTDYFELRGLTQDGAKKLISIANEVQATRDNLLYSVESSLARAATQLQTALEHVSHQAAALEEHVDKEVSNVMGRCTEMSSDLQANDSKWSGQIAHLQGCSSDTEQKVVSFGGDIARQNEKLETLSVHLGANLESVTSDFSAYRDFMNAKIRKLVGALGVVAIGLIGSVSFFATRL